MADVDLDALRRLALAVEARSHLNSTDLVAVGRQAPAILAAMERLARIEAKIKQRRTALTAAETLSDRDHAAIDARLDELGVIEMAGEGDDAVF